MTDALSTGLTVLSDAQVTGLLENLAASELDELRLALASSLHEYSGGAQDTTEDAFQQPRRTRTRHAASRVTTEYAPLCAPEGMACKVTSQPSAHSPAAGRPSPGGALTLLGPDGRPLALLASPTLTAFRTALTSSCLLHRRATVHTLTVFGAGAQAYWHVRLALMTRGATIRHVNIVNHRFSDSAAGILQRFTTVPRATKEREGWAECRFSIVTRQFKEFGRLVKGYVRDADVIYCCTSKGAAPAAHEHGHGHEHGNGLGTGHEKGEEGEKEDEDLFDAGFLTHHEGRKKGRLICAVGEGRELPEELLRLVTRTHSAGSHMHFHKHADEGGVIVVDTLQGAMREAGELRAAGIEATQLVELGELVMIHRQKLLESEGRSSSANESVLSSDVEALALHDRRQSSMSSVSPGTAGAGPRRSSSHSRKGSFPLSFHRHGSSASSQDKAQSARDDGLATWLRDGTVVYRSVGLGVTDLVVGMQIVQLANMKGVGTVIPGF